MSGDFNFVRESVKADLEQTLKSDGIDPAVASEILQNFNAAIDPKKVSFSQEDIRRISDRLYDDWQQEQLRDEWAAALAEEPEDATDEFTFEEEPEMERPEASAEHSEDRGEETLLPYDLPDPGEKDEDNHLDDYIEKENERIEKEARARAWKSRLKTTASMLPSIAVGIGTGLAVRMAFKVAAVTILGVSSPVALAVMGVVIGGLTKVTTDRIFGRHRRHGYSWKKAFVKGALTSAVFGGLTFGLAEAFDLGGADVDVPETDVSDVPDVDVPETDVSDLPDVDAPESEVPESSAPEATAPEVTTPEPEAVSEGLSGAGEVSGEGITPPPTEEAIEAAKAHVEALREASEKLGGIISANQLSLLPEDVQADALSKDPKEIMKFCKEASYHLLNDGHADEAAKTAARHLMEHGIAAAEGTDIAADDLTLQQLHADLAYMESHGLGGVKDMTSALEHADHSGKAVDDFGGRLRAFVEKAQEASQEVAAPETPEIETPEADAPEVESSTVETPEVEPPAEVPAETVPEVDAPAADAPVAVEDAPEGEDTPVEETPEAEAPASDEPEGLIDETYEVEQPAAEEAPAVEQPETPAEPVTETPEADTPEGEEVPVEEETSTPEEKPVKPTKPQTPEAKDPWPLSL